MDKANDVEKKKVKLQRNEKTIRILALTIVCFILGIFMAMQFKQIKDARSKSEVSLNTAYEYQRQLISMQEEMNKLTQEKAELQKKVDLFEQGNPSHQIEHLQNELKNINTFAGITKVAGVGIEVDIELSDPYKLSSMAFHILNLINELKASTAQAITVNGARLGPMSEVRVVGISLVVDGQVYSQPIKIAAIGDRAKLISGISLNTTGAFKTLGATITVTPRDNIIMEAYAMDEKMSEIDKLIPVE